MNHYGVILRQLRLLNKLQIKQAAARIERSARWLSEIENGKGSARIFPQEFERSCPLPPCSGGESHEWRDVFIHQPRQETRTGFNL